MTITDQVCTGEQAKRLKELGINPKAYFTWLDCKKELEDGSGEWHFCLFQPDSHLDMMGIAFPEGDTFDDYGSDGEFYDTKGNYPAFTSSELSVMLLPQYINPIPPKHEGELMIGVWKGRKGFRYRGVNSLDCSDSMPEAHARAGMLIDLLENNKVTADECNEKLKK